MLWPPDSDILDSMKSLCILTMVLAVAPLRAGLRVKVEVTDPKTGKVTEQQEILLDADRLRVNSSDNSRVFLFLTDGGRDRIVMLDQQRNEYSEIDQQMVNQATQMMQGMMAQMQAQLANMPPEQRARMEQMMKGRMGQTGQSAPAVTYTAKGSSTVNGFPCTRFEGVQGAEKVEDVCAAKPGDVHFSESDFQVFEKMRQFTKDLINNNSLMRGAGVRTDYFMRWGYEGYPVEVIHYSGGQPSGDWQVKSIERVSLSDADFSLGNAKKRDLIPGRGGRQ